jgi:hypothetical protein
MKILGSHYSKPGDHWSSGNIDLCFVFKNEKRLLQRVECTEERDMIIFPSSLPSFCHVFSRCTNHQMNIDCYYVSSSLLESTEDSNMDERHCL